jgi:hypothetical protein
LLCLIVLFIVFSRLSFWPEFQAGKKAGNGSQAKTKVSRRQKLRQAVSRGGNMSEKRKPASPGQDKELLAAVVRQFPYGEIDKERAQSLVSDYDGLHSALLHALYFDPARYFQSLLSACQQDEVNSAFHAQYFPIEPLASDEEEWEEHLYAFPDNVKGMDALQQLLKLGFRPCGVRRAMKFLSRHSGLQDQYNIIIATVGRDNEGESCLPVFDRNSPTGRRRVSLVSIDGTYCRTDRWKWLVLRPRQIGGSKQELQSLFAACHISKVPWFVGDNSPSVLEDTSGEDGGWEVHEHHFAETVNADTAMSTVLGVTRFGYRYLGGLRRGLQYISQQKDLPHPLVITMKLQNTHLNWCVPLIWQAGLTRRLRLVRVTDPIPPDVGWLVLRQKEQ